MLLTVATIPWQGWGLLLVVGCAQALVVVPLLMQLLLPALEAIPTAQREVAQSLGAGPLRVILTVDLPYLYHILLLSAGFAFAGAMGEFGATSFLTSPTSTTLPVALYKLVSHGAPVEQGLAMSGTVLLLVITSTVMIGAEYLNPQKSSAAVIN